MRKRNYLKVTAKRFTLVFPVISIVGAVTIFVLGIILFTTESSLVMTILSWIGVISFLLSISVLLLKYSGFFSMMGISNPLNFPVVNVAWVFAIWTLLVVGSLGAYSIWHGASQMTDFTRAIQDFIEEFKSKCPWW